MAKVLVVDDDEVLSAMIADWLKRANFTVEVVASGADARALLKDFHYDSIVLDWELPDIAGIRLLQEYRQNGGTGLVLMLTGRDHIDDKERGLLSGADDYLTKPFHIRELVARLQALGRRPKTVYQEVLKSGELTLNASTRQVFFKDKEISLLPKEFLLLEHFMRHPGQLFNADALIDRVWKSDAAVTRDSVRTCIKRLRRKLQDETETPYIENIFGEGYRIKADSTVEP